MFYFLVLLAMFVVFHRVAGLYTVETNEPTVEKDVSGANKKKLPGAHWVNRTPTDQFIAKQCLLQVHIAQSEVI